MKVKEDINQIIHRYVVAIYNVFKGAICGWDKGTFYTNKRHVQRT